MGCVHISVGAAAGRGAAWPGPKNNLVPRKSCSFMDIGAVKGFFALTVSAIPNLHLHDTGLCFPLYWYEEVKHDAAAQGSMFAAHGETDADVYVRLLMESLRNIEIASSSVIIIATLSICNTAEFRLHQCTPHVDWFQMSVHAL